VGLLDYYRQFEGMTEEEVNKGLREEAAERKRKALTRVQTLDLSQTTWPELPHPRIVNAITFVARRGMHRYPHLAGSDLRTMLAERHGVDPARLILGNGAAELLGAAARALIGPGQQLLTLWPSYPLYPLMARRAQGQAVRIGGGVDELLAAAGDPAVRAVVLANPNDPTGKLTCAADLERLLTGLPDGVGVLLDEALIEFSDAQPTRTSLELLERHPRLLVFRTFSKAWGLAGLRVGYAIGGPGSEELLAELDPDLGVSELSQAGALEALRTCSEIVQNRVEMICRERPLLISALRERGFEVPDSQANFLWAAHPTLAGAELSARLAQAGVLIAAGDALGEPGQVRVAVHSAQASERRWCPRGSCATRCGTRAAGRSVRRPCARAWRRCRSHDARRPPGNGRFRRPAAW
jgi:histidinol-phosphate aminotransferase